MFVWTSLHQLPSVWQVTVPDLLLLAAVFACIASAYSVCCDVLVTTDGIESETVKASQRAAIRCHGAVSESGTAASNARAAAAIRLDRGWLSVSDAEVGAEAAIARISSAKHAVLKAVQAISKVYGANLAVRQEVARLRSAIVPAWDRGLGRDSLQRQGWKVEGADPEPATASRMMNRGLNELLRAAVAGYRRVLALQHLETTLQSKLAASATVASTAGSDGNPAKFSDVLNLWLERLWRRHDEASRLFASDSGSSGTGSDILYRRMVAGVTSIPDPVKLRTTGVELLRRRVALELTHAAMVLDADGDEDVTEAQEVARDWWLDATARSPMPELFRTATEMDGVAIKCLKWSAPALRGVASADGLLRLQSEIARQAAAAGDADGLASSGSLEADLPVADSGIGRADGVPKDHVAEGIAGGGVGDEAVSAAASAALELDSVGGTIGVAAAADNDNDDDGDTAHGDGDSDSEQGANLEAQADQWDHDEIGAIDVDGLAGDDIDEVDDDEQWEDPADFGDWEDLWNAAGAAAQPFDWKEDMMDVCSAVVVRLAMCLSTPATFLASPCVSCWRNGMWRAFQSEGRFLLGSCLCFMVVVGSAWAIHIAGLFSLGTFSVVQSLGVNPAWDQYVQHWGKYRNAGSHVATVSTIVVPKSGVQSAIQSNAGFFTMRWNSSGDARQVSDDPCRLPAGHPDLPYQWLDSLHCSFASLRSGNVNVDGMAMSVMLTVGLVLVLGLGWLAAFSGCQRARSTVRWMCCSLESRFVTELRRLVQGNGGIEETLDDVSSAGGLPVGCAVDGNIQEAVRASTCAMDGFLNLSGARISQTSNSLRRRSCSCGQCPNAWILEQEGGVTCCAVWHALATVYLLLPVLAGCIGLFWLHISDTGLANDVLVQVHDAHASNASIANTAVVVASVAEASAAVIASEPFTTLLRLWQVGFALLLFGDALGLAVTAQIPRASLLSVMLAPRTSPRGQMSHPVFAAVSTMRTMCLDHASRLAWASVVAFVIATSAGIKLGNPTFSGMLAPAVRFHDDPIASVAMLMPHESLPPLASGLPHYNDSMLFKNLKHSRNNIVVATAWRQPPTRQPKPTTRMDGVVGDPFRLLGIALGLRGRAHNTGWGTFSHGQTVIGVTGELHDDSGPLLGPEPAPLDAWAYRNVWIVPERALHTAERRLMPSANTTRFLAADGLFKLSQNPVLLDDTSSMVLRWADPNRHHLRRITQHRLHGRQLDLASCMIPEDDDTTSSVLQSKCEPTIVLGQGIRLSQQPQVTGGLAIVGEAHASAVVATTMSLCEPSNDVPQEFTLASMCRLAQSLRLAACQRGRLPGSTLCSSARLYSDDSVAGLPQNATLVDVAAPGEATMLSTDPTKRGRPWLEPAQLPAYLWLRLHVASFPLPQVRQRPVVVKRVSSRRFMQPNTTPNTAELVNAYFAGFEPAMIYSSVAASSNTSAVAEASISLRIRPYLSGLLVAHVLNTSLPELHLPLPAAILWWQSTSGLSPVIDTLLIVVLSVLLANTVNLVLWVALLRCCGVFRSTSCGLLECCGWSPPTDTLLAVSSRPDGSLHVEARVDLPPCIRFDHGLAQVRSVLNTEEHPVDVSVAQITAGGSHVVAASAGARLFKGERAQAMSAARHAIELLQTGHLPAARVGNPTTEQELALADASLVPDPLSRLADVMMGAEPLSHRLERVAFGRRIKTLKRLPLGSTDAVFMIVTPGDAAGRGEELTAHEGWRGALDADLRDALELQAGQARLWGFAQAAAMLPQKSLSAWDRLRWHETVLAAERAYTTQGELERVPAGLGRAETNAFLSRIRAEDAASDEAEVAVTPPMACGCRQSMMCARQAEDRWLNAERGCAAAVASLCACDACLSSAVGAEARSDCRIGVTRRLVHCLRPINILSSAVLDLPLVIVTTDLALCLLALLVWAGSWVGTATWAVLPVLAAFVPHAPVLLPIGILLVITLIQTVYVTGSLAMTVWGPALSHLAVTAAREATGGASLWHSVLRACSLPVARIGSACSNRAAGETLSMFSAAMPFTQRDAMHIHLANAIAWCADVVIVLIQSLVVGTSLIWLLNSGVTGDAALMRWLPHHHVAISANTSVLFDCFPTVASWRLLEAFLPPHNPLQMSNSSSSQSVALANTACDSGLWIPLVLSGLAVLAIGAAASSALMLLLEIPAPGLVKACLRVHLEDLELLPAPESVGQACWQGVLQPAAAMLRAGRLWRCVFVTGLMVALPHVSTLMNKSIMTAILENSHDLIVQPTLRALPESALHLLAAVGAGINPATRTATAIWQGTPALFEWPHPDLLAPATLLVVVSLVVSACVFRRALRRVLQFFELTRSRLRVLPRSAD